MRQFSNNNVDPDSHDYERPATDLTRLPLQYIFPPSLRYHVIVHALFKSEELRWFPKKGKNPNLYCDILMKIYHNNKKHYFYQNKKATKIAWCCWSEWQLFWALAAQQSCFANCYSRESRLLFYILLNNNTIEEHCLAYLLYLQHQITL